MKKIFDWFKHITDKMLFNMDKTIIVLLGLMASIILIVYFIVVL